MTEYGRRDVWRALMPLLAAYAALGAIVIWRGYDWALAALATGPLVLIVFVIVLARRWGARTRDQLPDYIVSRAVHGLIHDWNRAEYVFINLRERGTWTLPDMTAFLAAAAKLEPFVGRVRQTGYWAARRRRFDELPVEVVQEAQRESRLALRQALLHVNTELAQRALAQGQSFQELRARGLCDITPPPFARATTWDELAARIDQMREERRAAVAEALRLLDRSSGLEPRVQEIRDAAHALHARGDDIEAIQTLLRIVPAGTKKPPPKPARPL